MFLLFILVISKTVFIISVAKENIRLILTLAIPTGIPITLVKEMVDIHPLVADKTIKALSK